MGREIGRALLDRGVELRVGARRSSPVADVLPGVRDVVPLDFGEPHVDPAVFEGVDAFFFMTPLIENQVAASRRVLDAAIAGGVEHVVRLSSRSAGWDQRSILRAWHREIEDAVRASGATWAILRPCSFFQNFIRYQSETIRNLSAIILPQGDGLISYIDAVDIGEAGAECLLHPDVHQGQTYVLTGGRAYGVKGIAAEISRVTGKPVTYISVEEEQARQMMLQTDMPAWLIEAGLAVFAHARKGGEAAVDPALTKILGRPAATLSDFVERNRSAW
ncbi:MAG: NmrA family NAD(P)-binding protein [Deltaproteobacteria bacterium]|nr:NmrA family NAD(P)-binding protein [Deltaproteobacteria bacterium]